MTNVNTVSSSTKDWDQILSDLFKGTWDPHVLQTISEESMKSYADFLLGVKAYYDKIKQWTIVTKEEREKFWPFLENQWWLISEGYIERDIARLVNIKDIAYHKYFWMTRWKMPGYIYSLDMQKDWEAFNEIIYKNINVLHKDQNIGNVSIYSVYLQNMLAYELDMFESSHNSRFCKNTENYDGLNNYLITINNKLDSIIHNHQRWWQQMKNMRILLLELRYMYEVADTTHNVQNKRKIFDTIQHCESIITTIQNNEFEQKENEKKQQMEMKAVVEYCTKNNLKLDDIIVLSQCIEKIKKENQLKDESLKEITQQIEENNKHNKEIIQDNEKIFKEIIANAKKSTFGSDYKISKELIDKIIKIL